MRLMRSTSAASVVLLPLPVTPVTSTRPRDSSDELDDRRRQAERSRASESCPGSDASTRRSCRAAGTRWRGSGRRRAPARRRRLRAWSGSRSWCAGGSSRSAIASRCGGADGATDAQRCERAVDAHERRMARAQVDIRGRRGRRRADHLIKGHGGLSVLQRPCRPDRGPEHAPKPSERADTPGLGPQN